MAPAPHLDAQASPVAYQLLGPQGKKAQWGSMVQAAAQADVVLFGELHDNPISHWLQLELLKALHAKNRRLALGMEMFERDQQPVLDRLNSGDLPWPHFADSTRTWPNFRTDYAPAVGFAAKNRIPVVASNVPRHFARKVFREGWAGLEGLSDAERAQLAPLPIAVDYALSQYQAMAQMMAGHGQTTDSAATANFINAQALKDATMAHFIVQSLPANGTLLHLNGAFHSDYRQGIVWYLLRQRPGLKVLTISTVELDAANTPPAGRRNLADFVIAVPESMTKTH